MQRPTNHKIGAALIILLLISVSLLNAEPIHLQSGSTRFPILIDFPIAPETHYMATPNLTNSIFYSYTATDEQASIAYAVTIVSIPANLGSIPKDTAQMMLDQSLETQISMVDDAVGVKGKVIRSNSEPLGGYASRQMEVVRQTTPRLFGSYRAVFVNRLLVTVWASGLDTSNNRSQAKAFVKSLQIKQ
mgnify:CR=1 FL=1